ncbi:hypothetical protein [Mesorhizobium sp. M0118]|uniref:hypothetical protein n=1 Tax=Mesorhizobium sp. M0118 TaxID=2956884 RepID=UPI00333C4F15
MKLTSADFAAASVVRSAMRRMVRLEMLTTRPIHWHPYSGGPLPGNPGVVCASCDADHMMTLAATRSDKARPVPLLAPVTRNVCFCHHLILFGFVVPSDIYKSIRMSGRFLPRANQRRKPFIDADIEDKVARRNYIYSQEVRNGPPV